MVGYTEINSGGNGKIYVAPIDPNWASYQLHQGVNMPNQGGLFHDVKLWIHENRQVFYTIALIVVLDHFLFHGALRQKIMSLCNNALAKAESALQVGASSKQVS